jgi:hypothetical protein
MLPQLFARRAENAFWHILAQLSFGNKEDREWKDGYTGEKERGEEETDHDVLEADGSVRERVEVILPIPVAGSPAHDKEINGMPS